MPTDDEDFAAMFAEAEEAKPKGKARPKAPAKKAKAPAKKPAAKGKAKK